MERRSAENGDANVRRRAEENGATLQRHRHDKKQQQHQTNKHNSSNNNNKKREKKLAAIPHATDGSHKLLSAPSEVIVPYAFENTLPLPPAEPRLSNHDFDVASFVRYRYDSQIEANRKCRLLAEPDLGVPIDLVDTSAFDAVPGVAMDKEDETLIRLIGEMRKRAAGETAVARGKHLRSNVTWLRKPVHIVQKDINSSQMPHMAGAREPAGSDSTALARADVGRPRRLDEISDAVEDSFVQAARLSVDSLKGAHPSGDKSITPLDVLPVLPDVQRWPHVFGQLNFDCNPALETPADTTPRYRNDVIGRSMLYKVPAQKDMLAYLVPGGSDGSSESAEEGASIDMEWARDYKFEVQRNDEDEAGGQAEADSKKKVAHFLVEEEGCMLYNVLEFAIKLKRKATGDVSGRPVSIKMARRELFDDEAEARQLRSSLLLTGPSQRLLTHTLVAGDAEPADDE